MNKNVTAGRGDAVYSRAIGPLPALTAGHALAFLGEVGVENVS